MSHVKVLAGSVREFKKDTILAPVYITLEAVLETVLPTVMASLIDQMGGGSMQPVVHYGLILILVAMASLFCGTMAARHAATASCGYARNLRHDLFYKVQTYAFSDIDQFSSSSLITRMTTDVTNIQNAYGMIIRIAFRAPLMMIFAIIMSLTINVSMAMIFIFMVPVIAFIIFLISWGAIPIFRRIFHEYDEMNNSVQENVQGIRVVKSFVREDYEIRKFKEKSEKVRYDFTHAVRLVQLTMPVMMIGIFAAMLTVAARGTRLIILSNGTRLTTGDLSALITYGVQIMASIMMVSMIVVMIVMSQESIERVCEVLDHDASITSPENGIETVADGSIDFDHVSFRYSKKSTRNALTDIDLHIRSGETVGIIGGTGSSKSSMVQLISRLYDATEGTVKVGGVDVKEYDLKALRDAVAVVLQKNVLFSGTIADNLRWGNKNATMEQIQHACHLARADEFIDQFPDGYDTWIEQGGTNVSGGQKQRLCIARALLKNPKILILDDSTSAVDTRTDALIRESFRDEIPDTTKLIIAQRISSVQDADRILVMDGGRIAEMGTHEQLLKLHGIYREVYDTQNASANGKEAV